MILNYRLQILNLIVEEYGQYRAEARNRIFNSLTKKNSEVATFKRPDAIKMLNADQTADKHILNTDSAKLTPKFEDAVGDLVLKTVSRVMRSQLREYDIAGRYGGEEFALLLPFTKLKEAKMVAERLRKTIEATKIDISEVNPDIDKKEINVTISLGIYEFKNDDAEDDLLKKADKALYEAKGTGRNRVIVYE